MKKASFITLIIACLSSCNQFSTKFRQDIPSEDSMSCNIDMQIAAQLKADSLISGYDSIQIRIWQDNPFTQDRQFLCIKRKAGNWSAAIYEIAVDGRFYNNTGKASIKKITAVTPISGWDSFIKKLFALKITTLPTMYDIPAVKNGCIDGINYHFEIATIEQYKFYQYHCPEQFGGKIWQAKNVTEILALTGKELDWY